MAISDLIVPDPDDGQRVANDALDLIDSLLLEAPHWDGLPEAVVSYTLLVERYEKLYGCLQCGLMTGHKFDCTRA